MKLLAARRRVACVFTLMFTLLAAAPGDAASIKDQAFEPPTPDTIPTISGQYRWAQTFMVGVTGTLTRSDVLVAQMFGVQPEDLDVTIFDTVAGAPHLPLTAPFHISAASVPIVAHPSSFDSYAYLSASFTLPVTTGDVLAIVVSTGSSSQYYWAGVYGGGYSGGQLYQTTTNTWSPSGTEDQAFRTFVAASRPPIANAGSNQTVRPGTTVMLDGSGSFDDNTATPLLQYAWSFKLVPNGSAVTLAGADTMTPSFIPDLFGNYVVQLVVTDGDGLSSQPSQVMIGENLPPTASAGQDQVVIVGEPVTLSGSAIDPDGDPIAYEWRLSSVPTGSLSQIPESTLATTSFVPDVPGVYLATLTPSDFVGAGTSATATITATTATGYAEIQAQAAASRVRDLPADVVTSLGNQNALIQLFSNAVVALQNSNATGAQHQLEEAMSRIDGCALRGASDGNGPGRDWITTCAAQEQIYPLVFAALTAITP
jgi:K319-like protein